MVTQTCSPLSESVMVTCPFVPKEFTACTSYTPSEVTTDESSVTSRGEVLHGDGTYVAAPPAPGWLG
jgi:hypothetical protein